MSGGVELCSSARGPLSSLSRSPCAQRFFLDSRTNMAAAPVLAVDGLVLKGPQGAVSDDAQADALIKALEDQWGWGPEVSLYLREELEIETLHDLIASFQTDKHWNDFYDADIMKTGSGDQVKRGKRARVAQCHRDCKDRQTEAADIRAKGEEAVDLDAMLKSGDLKAMQARFWGRHKLVSPLQKMPGDTLLSRLWRELDKRFLHITDLLRIKGVAYERRAQARDKKVGDNLYAKETPDEQTEDRPETVRAYLEVMEMYMLALAIVGSDAVDPLPKDPESKDRDPSDYVRFPYQYSVDYLHRANDFVTSALSVHNAGTVFKMLKTRDEAERGEWVHRIRNEDTRTLGKIFKEVFAMRAEVWRFDADEVKGATRGDASGDAKTKSLENQVRQLKEANALLKGQKRTNTGEVVAPSRSKGAKSKGAGRGQKTTGGGGEGKPVTVRKMRNGQNLCGDYNQGKCPKNKCKKDPPELHKCNGKLPGQDSACAAAGHTSQDCRNCERR